MDYSKKVIVKIKIHASIDIFQRYYLIKSLVRVDQRIQYILILIHG